MEDRRSKIILAIVVGFLMSTSVIGFAFLSYSGPNESLEYKGYKFERQQDGSLTAKIKGKPVSFTYFPAEIENVQLNNSIIGRLNSTRMFYTTSDYYSNHSQVISLIQYDLGLAMNDHYRIYVVRGFLQNATQLPVVNCGNATEHVPVILFQESNQTQFRMEGNCIIAEADSFSNFVIIRDRLLYGLLGVMNG